MGKYGIGARVRDEDGDEGVIILKRKGDRLVRFRGYDLWLAKSSLTAIPLKLEIGKTYVDRDGGEHGPLVANATDFFESSHPFACGHMTWKSDGQFLFDGDGEDDFDLVAQVVERPSNGTMTVDFSNGEIRLEAGDPEFKVGQRVALKTSATWGDHGVGEVVPASTDARDGMVGVVYPRDNFKWHFDPDELVHFTLEAGKFYRTRDGRKVGPMVNMDWDDGYPWIDEEYAYGYYSSAGQVQRETRSPHEDIVAEWVEPEAEENAVRSEDLRVGQRVRPSGKHRDWVLSHWAEHWADTEGHGPATEFYVVSTEGYGPQISDQPFGFGPYWPDVDWVVLAEPATRATAPVVTVGTDVILTAPARVTGFDRRNAHIVLDTGGSFVLPIAALQAA